MGKAQDVFQNRIIGYATKPADQFQANPLNYRKHPQRQRDAVNGSLRELGWIAAVVENVQTGNLIDGHERVWQALKNNEDVPYLQVDLTEAEERLALAIFDPITNMAETDAAILDELLQDVNTGEAALQELLATLATDAGLYSANVDFGVDKNAKPNPRKLPLDVIYTLQGADATCCLAVRAGLKYGIQSPRSTICPYCSRGDEAHAVTFIDNNYFDYNHDAHVKMCADHRPKYATVRDVMTPEQCEKDKIKYYSLGEILDFATEIEQYVENVIFIPKYDCLDQIPEKYMLGYSVPTSHGGTPLPPEMFKGRRVHLLGGSWKAQLAHMAILGDDVMSVDNNHVHNISRWAQYVDPEGETHVLTDVGFPWATNPRYVALALSFGAIGAKVNELYGGFRKPAEIQNGG